MFTNDKLNVASEASNRINTMLKVLDYPLNDENFLAFLSPLQALKANLSDPSLSFAKRLNIIQSLKECREIIKNKAKDENISSLEEYGLLLTASLAVDAFIIDEMGKLQSDFKKLNTKSKTNELKTFIQNVNTGEISKFLKDLLLELQTPLTVNNIYPSKNKMPPEMIEKFNSNMNEGFKQLKSKASELSKPVENLINNLEKASKKTNAKASVSMFSRAANYLGLGEAEPTKTQSIPKTSKRKDTTIRVESTTIKREKSDFSINPLDESDDDITPLSSKVPAATTLTNSTVITNSSSQKENPQIAAQVHEKVKNHILSLSGNEAEEFIYNFKMRTIYLSQGMEKASDVDLRKAFYQDIKALPKDMRNELEDFFLVASREDKAKFLKQLRTTLNEAVQTLENKNKLSSISQNAIVTPQNKAQINPNAELEKKAYLLMEQYYALPVRALYEMGDGVEKMLRSQPTMAKDDVEHLNFVRAVILYVTDWKLRIAQQAGKPLIEGTPANYNNKVSILWKGNTLDLTIPEHAMQLNINFAEQNANYSRNAYHAMQERDNHTSTPLSNKDNPNNQQNIVVSTSQPLPKPADPVNKEAPITSSSNSIEETLKIERLKKTKEALEEEILGVESYINGMYSINQISFEHWGSLLQNLENLSKLLYNTTDAYMDAYFETPHIIKGKDDPLGIKARNLRSKVSDKIVETSLSILEKLRDNYINNGSLSDREYKYIKVSLSKLHIEDIMKFFSDEKMLNTPNDDLMKIGFERAFQYLQRTKELDEGLDESRLKRILEDSTFNQQLEAMQGMTLVQNENYVKILKMKDAFKYANLSVSDKREMTIKPVGSVNKKISTTPIVQPTSNNLAKRLNIVDQESQNAKKAMNNENPFPVKKSKNKKSSTLPINQQRHMAKTAKNKLITDLMEIGVKQINQIIKEKAIDCIAAEREVLKSDKKSVEKVLEFTGAQSIEGAFEASKLCDNPTIFSMDVDGTQELALKEYERALKHGLDVDEVTYIENGKIKPIASEKLQQVRQEVLRPDDSPVNPNNHTRNKP